MLCKCYNIRSVLTETKCRYRSKPSTSDYDGDGRYMQRHVNVVDDVAIKMVFFNIITKKIFFVKCTWYYSRVVLDRYRIWRFQLINVAYELLFDCSGLVLEKIYRRIIM